MAAASVGDSGKVEKLLYICSSALTVLPGFTLQMRAGKQKAANLNFASAQLGMFKIEEKEGGDLLC